ncbi:MAG: hypothetical protein H7Y89_00065 [Steroidobacteraceae bacterium]|nr:hypothetical protein [Steroidobacteraceae bacterium]
MPAFVFANSAHDATLAMRRAAERFWTSFQPHREITTSLGISGAVHLALLLVFGAAIYVSGEDEVDVPELSVQLVTREGPNSHEFTEAALPQPAPDPVEQVIDDPGSAMQSFDAPAVAESLPLLEQAPDVVETDTSEAFPQAIEAGTVIATTSESIEIVPQVLEPTPAAPIEKPEQVMITKSVSKLAQQMLDTNLTNQELSWSEDGRQYSARLRRQPAADSTGLEQVVAEIMTENNGKRMKTRLSLKRLAFSNFTQLVNNWDPRIALHDDIIDGRFHSNTEIGIAFNGGIEPRFFGKVTTAAAKMTFEAPMRRRNKEVFQGGVETRTERVSLPRDLPDVVNGGSPADRRVFETDTRVIFNSDGSYAWRAANGDGPLERGEPSEQPRYLIAEKGAKLYVSGTVSGMFTVYSPTDIEIENDLVYAKDPRSSLFSRDFVALISGRDIKIANGAITGAGDLHIHGALFARRRFCIENPSQTKPGTLYILGSLTAGTIWETEPRFATKMDYDKRFEYLRPANFPMTRRYEVETWDRGWEEVDTGERSPSTELARSE